MFSKKNKLFKYLLVGTSISVSGLGFYKIILPSKKLVCKEKDLSNCDKYIQEAISRSRKLLTTKKLLHNCPAINVSVSVDGRNVWSEGFGMADVENHVPCTPSTSMRIASVSKCITMALVAKLHQEGLLDLDKPVHEYVPKWPEKYYKGKKAVITTRQLVSMMGGIRTYEKCYEDPDKKPKSQRLPHEMYQNKPYASVTDALDMFKDDDLCSIPGTQVLYSNHGWTLISAVVEAAAGQSFPSLLEALFYDLGLKNTHLDRNSRLIENRARYYQVGKDGRLMNAPAVDLSYKWAAGGLMSTPEDLCLFGNTMLACYQGCKGCNLQGDQLSYLVGRDKLPSSISKPFLSQDTVKMLWKQVGKEPGNSWLDCLYAMGWCSSSKKPACATLSKDFMSRNKRQYFYHTGGAVGASSILMVVARDEEEIEGDEIMSHTKGTVVAITTNMYKVGFIKEAMEIANLFEDSHDAQIYNE